MSIIYSSVSRSDVVLAEHTKFVGNFALISRNLLKKVTEAGKKTFTYTDYKFHIFNQNNVSYICICDGSFSDEIAFTFLKEAQIRFSNIYNSEEINQFHSYQLTEFSEVLQQLTVNV